MTNALSGRLKSRSDIAALRFETRGIAALLTVKDLDLILRSIAERCVSKDEAAGLQNALL